MPGLVGIISRLRSKNCERDVKTMQVRLQHEDFYHSGVYSNAEMSVYVGWTSQPKSFGDNLPATNLAKDVLLFFSGEVFDNQNQSSVVDRKGGKHNAEHLISLYEKCGEKFLDNLNGWFCGLLLDTRIGKAYLFNDRYGMHRLFIHENKSGLYFSSEAKALLAVLPEVREFDPKGLGEILTCGGTLGSRSLYKNISVFPLASLWEFEHGEVKRRSSYFDLQQWVAQKKLNEKEFSNRFVELFGDVVKRYAGGPLDVGISLTGGLDSRMVMSCLSKFLGEYTCYTFGSMYRDTLDVQVAREVAKACSQPHYVLVLDEEFLRNFPKFLEKSVYISDGYLGMSGAAELYVNSLARVLAPVRLTGNYGGELLRGHCAFKYRFPQGEFIFPELKPFLYEAQKTFEELKNTDAITFSMFKQANLQGYGRQVVERSQIVPRTPFMDNDLVKLAYQAPPNILKGEGLSVDIISRYGPHLLDIPTERGLLCSGSMFRSMTLQLQRKTLIKAEYLSSHGMPNWLAAISRYGFGSFIDKSFLGRDKFQHFRTWIRKDLASYSEEVLHRDVRTSLDNYIDLPHVRRMLHDHINGKRNFAEEIDAVMTLVLAEKLLF